MRSQFPEIYGFLRRNGKKLEQTFKDGVCLEFVRDRRGKVYVLQVNHISKTPRAAFIVAFDLLDDGLIKESDIPDIIQPHHQKMLLNPLLPAKEVEESQRLGRGVSVFDVGFQSARAYFSPESLLAAHRKQMVEGVLKIARKEKYKDLIEAASVGEESLMKLARSPKYVDLMEKVMAEKEPLALIAEEIDLTRHQEAIEAASSFGLLGNAVVHLRQIVLQTFKTCVFDLQDSGVKFMGTELGNGSVSVREGEWITLVGRNATLYKGQIPTDRSKLDMLINGQKVEYTGERQKVYLDKLLRCHRRFQEIQSKTTDAPFDDLKGLIDFIRRNFSQIQKSEIDPDKIEVVNNWVRAHLNEFSSLIEGMGYNEHQRVQEPFRYLDPGSAEILIKHLCLQGKTNVAMGVIGSLIPTDGPYPWLKMNDDQVIYLLQERLYYLSYESLKQMHGDRGRAIRAALSEQGDLKKFLTGYSMDLLLRDDLLMQLRFCGVDIESLGKKATGPVKDVLKALDKIKWDDLSEWDQRALCGRLNRPENSVLD